MLQGTTTGGGGALWQAVRMLLLMLLQVEVSVSVSPHWELLEPSLAKMLCRRGGGRQVRGGQEASHHSTRRRQVGESDAGSALLGHGAHTPLLFACRDEV